MAMKEAAKSNKEETRSSKMKVKQDGKSDKHNSKRVHDKAEHSGGKEISLTKLK